MRVKKVNRYYCEFCKKAGCSGGHIKKHEERCTMNPNRICGYCQLLKQEQPAMLKLIALLPNPKDYKEDFGHYISFDEHLTTITNAVLPQLREACGNCPACIMAAIRQKGIPVGLVTDFNYTKETDKIWADFNEAQTQNYYRGNCCY